jgi:hypothetical protein
VSTVIEVRPPGALGLNVISRPSLSTAVHWLVEGQAMLPLRGLISIPPVAIALGSMVVWVGLPGAFGLNVSSCPSLSRAVHCLLDGHANPMSEWPLSMVAGAGGRGAFGLNVTSLPTDSAVHWALDGHAIPTSSLPVSIVVGVGVPGTLGLNVTSRPAPSVTVHWLVEGQATPLTL